MKTAAHTILYTAFSEIIDENFSEDDSEIYRAVFTEQHFFDALGSNTKSRDYQAEDARGFGDSITNIPIDTLLNVIKWLATAIAGKLATDATVSTIYASALSSIRNMPRSKYEAWQPWTSRLEAYLATKCK